MGCDHNIRKAKERMVPAKKKKTDQKVKLSLTNNDYERDH